MRRVWLLGVLFGLVSGCGDTRATPDLTLANLNFLHGIFCASESASCRLEDRTDLLEEWIREAGCPDVITLQEIFPPSVALLEEKSATICPFPYAVVQGDVLVGVDDETVLSRYPVVAKEQLRLFGNFRSVLHVMIDHPSGLIDIFSTHLASGADGGSESCMTAQCPAYCTEGGAQTRRDCQAIEMAEWIETRHQGPNPALIAGDFNARPESFTYRQFTERGWPDAYLVAGNPECDPTSGIGCTSGRGDEGLASLETPELGERSRIDFVFVVPAQPEASCLGVIEPMGDPDGDGTSTGLFADIANPFAEVCGEAPYPICWPSDHVGVQIDLQCG